MQHRMLITGGIAALMLACAVSPALAGDPRAGKVEPASSAAGTAPKVDPAEDKARIHGGEIEKTPSHVFEVLFTETQARIYAYDAKGMPITDPKSVKANLTLTTRSGKPETLALQYLAPSVEKGRTQGYFYANRSFAGEQPVDLEATISVTGLEKAPIEFRAAFVPGHLMSYACPKQCIAAAEDPMKCPKCGSTLMAEVKPVSLPGSR